MNPLNLTGAVRSLGHALAALTTNCPEFKREWEHAKGSGGAGDRLDGRWEGEWVSQTHGHRGAVRCAMSHLDANRYRASFHATYSRLLRVCYTVELQARRAGDSWHLEGEADLGKLAGGVYKYEGEADNGSFVCQYRSSYDQGTFELKRNLS